MNNNKNNLLKHFEFEFKLTKVLSTLSRLMGERIDVLICFVFVLFWYLEKNYLHFFIYISSENKMTVLLYIEIL